MRTPFARGRENSKRRIHRKNLRVEHRIDRRVRHCVGTLNRRDFDQRRRDYRIRELPQRAFVERGESRRRWNNRATGELSTSIDNVDVTRAAGERTAVHFFGIVALADIDDERDDIVRSVRLQADPLRAGEPLHRRARCGVSVKREHDALIVHGCAYSRSNRLTRARARRASRAITRMVSSPASVPTTSGRCAASIATPSSCA